MPALSKADRKRHAQWVLRMWPSEALGKWKEVTKVRVSSVENVGLSGPKTVAQVARDVKGLSALGKIMISPDRSAAKSATLVTTLFTVARGWIGSQHIHLCRVSWRSCNRRLHSQARNGKLHQEARIRRYYHSIQGRPAERC